MRPNLKGSGRAGNVACEKCRHRSEMEVEFCGEKSDGDLNQAKALGMIRMKISYDPEHDVLYLNFSENKIVDTVEVDRGVLIDYGESGEMIGVEMIEASSLVDDLSTYEI